MYWGIFVGSIIIVTVVGLQLYNNYAQTNKDSPIINIIERFPNYKLLTNIQYYSYSITLRLGNRGKYHTPMEYTELKF